MVYLYYFKETNEINISKTLIDGKNFISDVTLQNGKLIFSNVVHLTKIIMITDFDINILKTYL